MSALNNPPIVTFGDEPPQVREVGSVVQVMLTVAPGQPIVVTQ